MMRSMLRLMVMAATVCVPAVAAHGEAVDECAGTAVKTRSLDEYWTKAVQGKLRYEGDYLDLLLRDTPTFAVRSQQDSSPSANGTDATVVNAADFTKLLSTAFDLTQGNEDGNDNKGFTLNVNPFLLAVIMNNDFYYSPARYMEPLPVIMRRFGGSVTFGGKGEAFDRDGDGTADDPLESEAFDDIVTWEVRFRPGIRDVWRNSRDRRENIDVILRKVDIKVPGDAKARVREQLAKNGAMDAVRFEDCVREDRWKENQQLIDSAIAPALKANQDFLDALEEIDRQLLVTAVITGVERKKDFGSDKHGIGLRATWQDLDANVDWTHMSGLTNGAEDIDEVRIGIEYGTQILQGWSFKNGANPDKPSEGWLKNGIDVSLGAAVEIFNDTPDVEHDTTIKIQGKLEIPVSEGVRFPISVTWANHADLLDEDDKIVGHFGVNLDTDKLLGLAKGLL